MKYLICLIGLLGILTFLRGNQTQETFAFSSEQRAICYLESTATPPLAAIENSVFGTASFDIGYKNQSKKGFLVETSNKKPVSFFLNPIIYKHNFPYLTKSTSLFLIFHFSQSLWRVILC